MTTNDLYTFWNLEKKDKHRNELVLMENSITGYLPVHMIKSQDKNCPVEC